jgi:hypothetical protein
MQTCNEVTTYTVASLKTFHPIQPYMAFLDVHVTRYVTAVHDTAVADHCCSQAVVYCLFDTSTHRYTSLFSVIKCLWYTAAKLASSIFVLQDWSCVSLQGDYDCR